ncbi:DNA cytosine methyltransferase [Winogradskyella sp.]|uniref:DNA cytosine methyltransferase n=1 Tax=Winogradskyella sp. TaxID=1883156 RepID=UPI00261982EC|nr:DNA cytosine methyltransferase [Winogradskyella sp.]
MNKTITHIDCFSGPGGICTGFKAAGIETKIAIEKVESCVDTYSHNHPSVSVIHKDIRKVSEKDIKERYNGTIDILTSGMPCETFSTAGATSRSSYDFRQQLYSEAIRIAKIVQAKIILFENVPGILSKKVEKGGKRLIIEDLFDELSSNGYKYYIQTTLKANDFQVPQKRERYFIIATNQENLDLSIPIAKHNGETTVKDAFLGLPKIEANDPVERKKYNKGESKYTELLKDNEFWKLGKDINSKLTYHVAPKHRASTIKRFELIEPGENLKDLFFKFPKEEVEELQKQKILPKKWFIQRNKRLEFNKVSKTVTSHCLDELVHPKLNRALTVREVARLQSFPDNYQFVGGPFICPHMYETQDKYEQIGDAVPPLLAYHWGLTIKKILQG